MLTLNLERGGLGLAYLTTFNNSNLPHKNDFHNIIYMFHNFDFLRKTNITTFEKHKSLTNDGILFKN